jgi:hypothetical protein
MHRRPFALALAAGSLLAGTAALATVPTPAPALVSGAHPVRVKVATTVARYPVFDARGRRVGSKAWRTSAAGGNCCETYVAATPTGRVIEAGGTFPWYTDDKGRTWHQVVFDIPDQNDNGQVVAGGEGAVVVGPHGDVYGVTWDAYSGDHVQAYRFSTATGSWSVSEVPLHSPFFDRPWLTYAKGPFVVGGDATGALLDITGGGLTKDQEVFSRDGLDYDTVSVPYADEKQHPTVRASIPVVRNPDADWWQPNPGTATLPLSGGGLLRFANTEDLTGDRACDVGRLRPSDATWECVALPTRMQGIVRQDSRGWLTEVSARDAHTVLLRLSADGGRHWRSTLLRPPRGGTLEGYDAASHSALIDVKASGRLGQAVVSVRSDGKGGNGQDMVFRVDIRHAQPRVLATYFVGRGDVATEIGVGGSLGNRFDYESVALLPDGSIAVTFDDSTTRNPTPRNPDHRAPQVAFLL